MIETVLLVPRADNAGKRFPRRTYQAVEDRLFAAAGGFTVTDNVRGAWQLGGRVYTDVSRQYAAALSSWWQLPAWLQIVDWARVVFAQEALYVKVAGIPEIRSA